MSNNEAIEALEATINQQREVFVDYLMFLFDVEELDNDKYVDLLDKLKKYEDLQAKYKSALNFEIIKHDLFDK